jgi:hypothetical protein
MLESFGINQKVSTETDPVSDPKAAGQDRAARIAHLGPRFGLAMLPDSETLITAEV